MQKRIDNKEVAFLKNLIKSRRGIAIELAIGVMMLMTAFSIILLTTGTLQAQQRKDDYNNLVQKIEINEIGEYVCENIDTLKDKADENGVVHLEGDYSSYYVEITDDETIDTSNIITFTICKESDPLLIIAFNTERDTIISWK